MTGVPDEVVLETTRPPDGLGPAIKETHISVLLLIGDRVYKLKKPVRLPFLDWTERTVREAMCHREVELNRRLAPDVYLGVLDIVRDGELCDHVVVMRRMPDERRLSTLVRAGTDVGAQLRDLAGLIARFHRNASRSAAITAAGGLDAVRRNWNDNLATLQRFGGRLVDSDDVECAGALAARFLEGRAPLFAARAAKGRIVDGHGDLLADDIYLLDDGPRVLDCLEFSDELRCVDGLDDVAFLAMDLERLGAADLAERFLTAYRRASDDDAPRALAEHFVAYRAGVRSKVACLRADQGGDDRRAPSALLQLARRHLEQGRVRLVLVGGLPGTGKSTLARALATRHGWVLLRSDVVRKELVGVGPGAGAVRPMPALYGEGIYTEEHTRETYGALLAEARRRLGLGESVVVDASWASGRDRDAAVAVANETASDLVALQCVAPMALAALRLERRKADASDATPEIARHMATRFDPWVSASLIDTDATIDASLRAAERAIAGQ